MSDQADSIDGVGETTMAETQQLKDTIEDLHARIVSIRDSL